MLSPRAQAFSVHNLLGASDEQDRKPARSQLAHSAAWDRNTIPGSSAAPRRDLTLVESPRPELVSCDVELKSLCRHPSVVTTAGHAGTKEEGVVRVELCQNDLWHAFHALGTEMIITRAGRRMFPAIHLHVTGLDPSALYRVSLEFVPCGRSKYRYIYQSSKWMVAGVVEKEGGQEERTYLHPHCPLSGHRLTSQALTFDKVKLTNCACPGAGQVSLSSMQKFQPQIHIDKVLDGSGNDVTNLGRMTFVFPQISFIAVTAYQNHQITRLKIARNPFAKGFRHIGKHRNSLPVMMMPYDLQPASCWPVSPGHCLPLPVRTSAGIVPQQTDHDFTHHHHNHNHPPGCFHPALQEWNHPPLPVSSLPLFYPPISPISYPFTQSEQPSPFFFSLRQTVHFAPVCAGKDEDDAWQDVTSKIEDGVASFSGCGLAMSAPVVGVRSRGDVKPD